MTVDSMTFNPIYEVVKERSVSQWANSSLNTGDRDFWIKFVDCSEALDAQFNSR
jgi:hypothetical protein